MKKIGILGSTGSVGLNALQVVRDQKDSFQVVVLAAGSNDALLEEQIREFRPELVALADETRGKSLGEKFKDQATRVVWGEEGLHIAATWENMEQVLFAIVGSQGLKPLADAIQAGKDVAIANKEPLVMAGSLIQELVSQHKVQLTPVDSEHSAIWQCLEGRAREDVKRILLTASGGPFFKSSLEALDKVTVEEALKHPRWQMGRKISVDSATMMNKGLEIIEAVNLFQVKPAQIDVLIHPESIIHSLIEFQDHSVLAQLSVPDMKLPIQYALSYPRRLPNPYSPLNLAALESLHFYEPDFQKFPALLLSREAAEKGGTLAAVLNGANEVAVKLFLEEKIRFLQIAELVEKVMSKHRIIQQPSLDDVLEADRWARQTIEEVSVGRVSV